MSYYQELTRISVSGNKLNVIRMLNAAIRNVGSKKTIVEGDDLETINFKIREEDTPYGLEVALFDLFDEICLQDEKLQEKIKKIQREWKSMGESVGEYDCDKFVLLNVREIESGYTVDIEICEFEGDIPGDWEYLEDIARLYQCRIIADHEGFRNGRSLGLDYTSIREPEGDGVKEKYVEYPDFKSCEEVDSAFEPLMELDPQHYRKIKIRAYEVMIYTLEYQTREAKATKEWYETMEEEGLELPSLYRDFVLNEQRGPEDVKSYHQQCLIMNYSSEEELATIYGLRAKRCQDDNKELADLYNQFLVQLHTDIEEANKRRASNSNDEDEEPF